MKLLDTQVKRHGHTLDQVWRDERSAIYRWRGGYELILIKIFPAQTFPSGKSYPEREVYPIDKDWGSLAITRPNSDELEYLQKRCRDAQEKGSFAAWKHTPSE